MSWETVRNDRNPCPCGQGYVHSVSRSDDWGRWEEGVSLHCLECEKTYVKYSYDNSSKGMVETTIRWVKRDDYNNYQRSKKEWKEADLLYKRQITEYLRLHYLESWMALFKDVRRTKKAVWSKLRELRITGYSYSLFCKHIDVSQLNDHIESYVSYQFSDSVLKMLEVNDETIGTLAASSREATQRYHKAWSQMLQNSFS